MGHLSYSADEQLKLLKDRAEEIHAELQVVQDAIEAEEARLAAQQNGLVPPGAASMEAAASAASAHLHKRPSWSLLGGVASADAAQPPLLRQLGPEDSEDILSKFPRLDISPIGQFNHWDRRECAVANKEAWCQVCDTYMRETLRGQADIPKMIHMIWVGPKEPPCLWIDTFRVNYLAANPDWAFTLWSDDRVSELPMFNEQIYREEKMWQCKADILRLEILWHYGGLYVDADMISVENKSLNPVLELAKETGFAIAYEPDTKDKPYSILGNSVIAATPHHPLTLMLILYLKQTYYEKRPHIDVFMVTGPVMYTKCLIDSGMPLSVPPQEWFYPAFHFVPNPDAIDLSRFPKCLMFQFGYTCSGLEGYVKSKNRCKKARECPFHCKKAWPLGPFKPLPSQQELEGRFQASGSAGAPIPPVVHQLVYHGVDSQHDPLRWRQSWWETFKRHHPHFQYRVWSRKELEGKEWFCANLYTDSLDDAAATALMLEILFNEGGYYAPLSTIFSGGSADPFFASLSPANGFIEAGGGMVASAPGAPGCFLRLMELYRKGVVDAMAPLGQRSPKITPMGFYDGAMCNIRFSKDSAFLGAECLAAFSAAAGVVVTKLETDVIGMAYQCQVPCRAARGRAGLASSLECAQKVMVITDHEFFMLQRLRDELPGLICGITEKWDVLVFGCEWHTGADEVALFRVPMGGRPADCRITGCVVNLRDGRADPTMLRRLMQDCVSEDGFEAQPLFDAAGALSLWFGAEKYSGSLEQAKIFRAMPAIHRAFTQLAGHHPPMHFEQNEIHGNLMKGFEHGRLRFEIMVEPNGGAMFRAWNDDNSTNCEAKTSSASRVEWMRVYFDHQVVFDGRDLTF